MKVIRGWPDTLFAAVPRAPFIPPVMLGTILGVFGAAIAASNMISSGVLGEGSGVFLRSIAAGALGGGLAVAVVEALQSHMRTLVRALAIGVSAAFIYCITVVVAAYLGIPTSPSTWATMLGASLAVGTLIGGLTREAILYRDPAGLEDVSRFVTLFVQCVDLLQRATPDWLDPSRRRREVLRSLSFPAEWDAIVRKNVPSVSALTPAEYDELQKQILVFVAEKNVEGCGELEITDEIRVTVAAQACLLTVGRRGDYYPRLRSVLVYPSTVMPVRPSVQPSWRLTKDPEPILGESWDWGVVVLAWDSTLEGAANPRDGHNVVLHEFAHQLDQEDGVGDGVPRLPTVSSYRAWTSLMPRERARLARFRRKGRPVVLDHYGAESPAEFFAVATEAFFEKGRQLRASWPELYGELKSYYGQDPALRTLPEVGQSEGISPSSLALMDLSAAVHPGARGSRRSSQPEEDKDRLIQT